MMRNRIISVLILLCLLMQLAVRAENVMHTVYEEDFSSCKIGSLPNERWIMSKNSTDTIGAIMYRDSRALKLSKGVAGDVGNTGAKVYLPNTVTGRAVVSASVMPVSENCNFAAMYVLDNEEKALVCCTFNNKGQIGIYYNNQWYYETEYKAGNMYRLRAEIDLDAHIFSFFVNDVPIAQDVATRSSGSAVGAVNMYLTTVNTSAYIHSLTVSGEGSAEPLPLPETEEKKPPEMIEFTAENTVFADDFEGYAQGEYRETLGGWSIVSEADGKAEIVTAGENKFARISKPDGSQKGMQALLYTPDTATAKALGDAVVCMEYKIKSSNPKKFIGGPYILSRTVTPAITVGFGNQGFAYVNAQTSSIGNYEPEKWYNIRLVIDYPNKIFDVYVNGEAVRIGEAFRSANSMDLKTVRFYTEAAGGDFCIDDFKITTSKKNMPAPADDILPIDKQITSDGAVYTISGGYVAARMSVLPPVIADVDVEDKTQLTIKADAVAILAKEQQDMTVRSDTMRMKIPRGIFKALDNGRDLSIVIESCNANDVWNKLTDKEQTVNSGVAVKIGISSGDEAVQKLADSISVKLSGCIGGDRDSRLTVIRVNPDNSSDNTVSKHDLLAEGIVFYTNAPGEFIAVRSRRGFADTNEHWAREYIEACAARGIADGYGDGCFRPEQQLTRAEAAVMLCRAIGLEATVYDNMFEDISGDEAYAPYAAALYYKKIISREIFGDAFRPEGMATRADMAYLVMNAYYSITGRDNDELTKFCMEEFITDLEQAPEKLRDYIKSAYVMDIMNGNDGKFRPNDNISRAETAKIIISLLEAVGYADSGADFRSRRLTDIYVFPFTYKSYQTYIQNSKLANMNENGAYGENVKFDEGTSDTWFMEEQRSIDDDIVPEIVRKYYLGNSSGEPELVEKLMKAVEWGFAHQDETGGFDGSSDEYHSSAFFIEEAGRILLLMKESGDSAYDGYIAEYLPKLHKAVRWMISDEEFIPYYKEKGYFDIYTHRYFYYAAAMLYTYRLTGDEQIKQKAHFLIKEGISRMTDEGILPEKGGFDIGYGVTSILCAVRCMFACDDPMLCSELKQMLVRSTEYIINKLDNKGNIDLSDSTRTGGQETKRDGVTVKTVSERSFYNTLLAMASVSGGGDFIKARDQMAVRQVYLTPAYMKYKDSGYDLSKERYTAEPAQPTGNKNLRLTELPVKGFNVSEEFGTGSKPSAMFGDDDNTEGWYARKLPQYVDIDLGIEREIGKLDIVFADTDAKRYTYSVMVSDDGTDWEYAAADLHTKKVVRNTAEFAYTKARYVRIWIQKIEPLHQSAWFTDIKDVRIYGIDRGEALDFQPLNSGYIRRAEY